MLSRLLSVVLYIFFGCTACRGFAEVYLWLQPTRLPAPTEQEIRQAAEY